jgi:hypothetical protein
MVLFEETNHVGRTTRAPIEADTLNAAIRLLARFDDCFIQGGASADKFKARWSGRGAEGGEFDYRYNASQGSWKNQMNGKDRSGQWSTPLVALLMRLDLGKVVDEPIKESIPATPDSPPVVQIEQIVASKVDSLEKKLGKLEDLLKLAAGQEALLTKVRAGNQEAPAVVISKTRKEASIKVTGETPENRLMYFQEGIRQLGLDQAVAPARVIEPAAPSTPAVTPTQGVPIALDVDGNEAAPRDDDPANYDHLDPETRYEVWSPILKRERRVTTPQLIDAIHFRAKGKRVVPGSKLYELYADNVMSSMFRRFIRAWEAANKPLVVKSTPKTGHAGRFGITAYVVKDNSIAVAVAAREAAEASA